MIENRHTDPLEMMDQNELRAKLLATSIVLSAYEIIKEMVVRRTKFLFLVGFGFGGDKYSDEYRLDVLSRHESALISSAKYLAEHYQAITLDDVDFLISLRDTRNNIAHELPSVLVDYEYADLEDVIKRTRELVFKLDNFWIYIDIGSDPAHIGTDWNSAYSNATIFVDKLNELLNIMRGKG